MATTETQILKSRNSRWARSGSVVSDLIVMLLFIVAIVGAVVGNILVTTLCGLVLVLVFVARLWARLAFAEVDYYCLPSNDRLMVGDAIDLTLTIENRKPLPLPWLTVSEVIPSGLEIEDAEAGPHTGFISNEIVETASLGQYERIRFHHRLKGVRRGHYAFGPTRIVSSDMFGFYEARLDTPKRASQLIVYPRVVSLPDFDPISLRPNGDSWTRSRRNEDLTRPNGLREYRPGEPTKAIDWKATARRDTVFVRTYDPSVSEQVVVLLECGTSLVAWHASKVVLERAIIGAASVAMKSMELGHAVGVVCNGNIASDLAAPVVAAGAGPGQLSAVMATLAGATRMIREPLEDIVLRYGPDALPQGATIIYIAGLFRPSTVAFVTDLGRRDRHVVALYVGDDETPEVPGLQIENYRAEFTVLEQADA